MRKKGCTLERINVQNRMKEQDAGPPDLTQLLRKMRSGDRDAGENVAELIYNELHRLAAYEIHRERGAHPLRTTALLHEAFMKLSGQQSLEFENRAHFYALASRQMRRILVDHARARNAQKRGGDAILISLDGIQVKSEEPGVDLLLLDEVLRELQQVDPRAAKVVELRYFGGYTDQEVAETLGASLATIRRDWRFARTWLFDRINGTRPIP